MIASLLLLSACTSDDARTEASLGFRIALDADMPLRARATWDASVAPQARVRFGAGTPTQETPLSGDGQATLLGMRAETEILAQLVDGSGEVLSETSFATGSLVAGVPELTAAGGNFGEGWILATSFGLDGSPPAVVALDGEGQVGWFHVVSSDNAPVGGHPIAWALQLEAGAVWMALGGEARTGFLRIPFDGGETTWIDVVGAHHDFLRLEDGSLAYTRMDTRVVGDTWVTGDQLLVRAPDGTERVAWDSFDTLPVTRHDGWNAFPAIRGDWTHANGIAWNPEAKQWTVSLYWLHQLVVVEDGSGSVVEVLDGHTTTASFGPQHAPTWVGDGWWLFDNASPASGSRALHLGTGGELLGEWRPPRQPYALALGDVTPLDDERLLVSGGVVPEIWAVRPDGDVLSVRWPQAHSVGQLAWTERLYATVP